MASDAMYKLEHGVDDKVKSKELDPVIERLEEFQSSRWHDDYASNRALRDSMRVRFILFVLLMIEFTANSLENNHKFRAQLE